MTDHTWRDHAACRGHDPELWFPDNKTAQGRAQAAQALSICRTCPVQPDCGAEARRLGDVYGIWGGTRIPQQQALHHYRTPLPPDGLAPCGTPAAYRRHQRAGDPPCTACRNANTRYYQDRHRRRGQTA